ncbi:MAG: hypothetical protein AAB845_00260, partial [Patescibacteria group bacterium]
WKKAGEAGYRSARSRFQYVAIQTGMSSKYLLYIAIAILAVWGVVTILDLIIGWLMDLVPPNIDLMKPVQPE